MRNRLLCFAEHGGASTRGGMFGEKAKCALRMASKWSAPESQRYLGGAHTMTLRSAELHVMHRLLFVRGILTRQARRGARLERVGG